MNNANKNIIKNTTISFDITGACNAIEVNKEIAAWCVGPLHKIINKAMNIYEQDNDILQLDKLELDINIDQMDEWEIVLNKIVEQKLKDSIKNAFAKGGKKTVVLSGAIAFFNNLVFYLTHGYLRWNSPASEFKKECKEWIDEISTEQKIELPKILSGEYESRRMRSLLNDELFFSFIGHFYQRGHIENVIAQAIIAVDSLVQNVNQKKIAEKIVWMLECHLIQSIAINNKSQAIEKAIENWIGQIRKSFPGFLKDIERPQRALNMIEEAVIKIENSRKQEQESPPVVLEDTGLKKNTLEDAGDIFISNAGTVIIAAFLPRFFENTGIAKSESIIEIEEALCIVHYCITGNDEPDEFDLLLPKVLCGIPPGEVIETPVKLSNEKKEEADNMLAAVIGHWNILKNTSIDGLRQSFLQRNGKLCFRNNEWLLQVEQQPFDMLLQQLPWNISMIKLPWMNYLLKTEWVY